uniref:Uncharacterized protein n=1 Tax=Anguilla anguilla TaxID=7936 RepID=A0A0E9RT76_ANGAN
MCNKQKLSCYQRYCKRRLLHDPFLTAITRQCFCVTQVAKTVFYLSYLFSCSEDRLL